MPRDRRGGANTRRLTVGMSREHLDRAQEFLRTARRALVEDDANAAGANAVLAGIAAADCVSGLLQGDRWQGAHEQAAKHVEKAGPEGKRLAAQLRKLVRKKTQTQYEGKPLSAKEAEDLLTAAERAVGVAEGVAARHE